MILSPFFGIIGILIKRDTPGPVFYRGLRMGRHEKPFKILKFRTMYEKPASYNGSSITGNGDPRITPIGGWLRETKLNELPQLWNVLKGEMSLVGPRPELPKMVQLYEPWQRARFAVPQGLTGWWQVNGRSDKPMHLHTDEDLYYIQHYSLWFDIRIILRTILVVLRGKGAY
jgi:lipopolysaccharide/colanic/teichoic acid biosynthesis glycosyltransferase